MLRWLFYLAETQQCTVNRDCCQRKSGLVFLWSYMDRLIIPCLDKKKKKKLISVHLVLFIPHLFVYYISQMFKNFFFLPSVLFCKFFFLSLFIGRPWMKPLVNLYCLYTTSCTHVCGYNMQGVCGLQRLFITCSLYGIKI